MGMLGYIPTVALSVMRGSDRPVRGPHLVFRHLVGSVEHHGATLGTIGQRLYRDLECRLGQLASVHELRDVVEWIGKQLENKKSSIVRQL